MSKISGKDRQKVIERAKGFCEYCLSDSAFSQDSFDIDHILPISDSGTNLLTNLALSCHGCNLHKSNKITGYDDLTESEVRLFNPRTDIWKEHFGWTKKFTVVVGLTPAGRVTVSELKMNRQGLINQRKIFRLLRKHPPKF